MGRRLGSMSHCRRGDVWGPLALRLLRFQLRVRLGPLGRKPPAHQHRRRRAWPRLLASAPPSVVKCVSRLGLLNHMCGSPGDRLHSIAPLDQGKAAAALPSCGAVALCKATLHHVQPKPTCASSGERWTAFIASVAASD